MQILYVDGTVKGSPRTPPGPTTRIHADRNRTSELLLDLDAIQGHFNAPLSLTPNILGVTRPLTAI